MPAHPTSRQLSYLDDLLTECHPGQTLAQFCAAAQRLNSYNSAHFSRCIDAMVTHRATLRQRRANARVAALVTGPLQSASAAVEGLTSALQRSGEIVQNAARAILGNGSTLDGIHIIDDHAYRVGCLPRRRHERQLDVNDPTRRRYVWRLVIAGNCARWVRMGELRAVLRNTSLSLDTLATLDQARTFGHAFGFCLNCGRTLVVEQSIERALGPVCFRRIMAQQDRRLVVDDLGVHDLHGLVTRETLGIVR